MKGKELGHERWNELFEKAVSFYVRTFEDRAEGRRFLESQGISDQETWRRHRAGYSDGSLAGALPESGKVTVDLRTAGILLEDGTERFLKCAVLPVTDVEGRILGLYGKHISTGHEIRLPGGPPLLFNIGTIKIYPEIILAGTVFDVLALGTAGAGNAVGLNGAEDMADADIALLRNHGVKKISVIGDAAGSIVERLRSAGFAAAAVRFPGGGSAQGCLLEHGREKLLSVLVEANDERPRRVSPAPPKSARENPVKGIGGGFSVTYGMIRYWVLGLEKSRRRLKATVRAEKCGRLHVDTIDFYSSKMRKQFCAEVCARLDETPETVEADIGKILTVCEAQSDPDVSPGTGIDSGTTENKAESISSAEKEEAEAFGRSEKLIGNILGDFVKCGLIGEENNKLLCYLAMTSRKMDEPLSVMILSSSGAGKSALQDAALDFCPPEDLVKLTSLSAKALFHKERFSLRHKVLAIEEGAGAEEANYAIRSLISSEGLRSEVTVRDPQSGRLTTLSNTVEGPSAVFCTTTSPDADQETRSRFLVTGIDESREQTRRILELQRRTRSPDGLRDNAGREAALRVHRNFQRLLRPLKVVNPHIGSLRYDDDRLQGRRTQPQYLNLINTVAFLRQMGKEARTYADGNSTSGKEVEYIEVDADDIRVGNSLAVEILGKSLDELSIPARNLLGLVEKMVGEIAVRDGMPENGVRFTRRELRESAGWTRTRTQIHLRELVEMEYAVVDSRRGGGLQYYRLMYGGQGKDGNRFIPGIKMPGGGS